MTRRRELDFLRGVAIILVLFRHRPLLDFTEMVGWVGVDLFFVLSGFLVSGLLFREYHKYGDVKPGLFLIRRGFKIYPLYYLTYILYLFPILYKGKFEWRGFLTDMLFVQNYFNDWAWAYSASWSLAVEEHFYIAFAVFAVLGMRSRLVTRKFLGLLWFEWLVMAMLIAVALHRALSYGAYSPVHTVTLSHLRIDSMLAGVLVSCAYHFHGEALPRFYSRFGRVVWVLAFGAIFAAILHEQMSRFTAVIGFALLYVGFAGLLVIFLCDRNINRKLDRMFSARVADFVARIGLASYSIYIVHMFVNYAFTIAMGVAGFELPTALDFVATSAVSIGTGFWLTRYVETWFLRMRDRIFPSRASALPTP